MSKRSFITSLISVLMIAAMLLALTGCGSGNGKAGSTDDYYTLSLTMHDPVTSAVGVLYQEWADEIYDLTDGHVTIELYGSATLAPGTEVVDYVQSGAADIGWIYTAFFSGQFPLTEVVSVPMSGLYHPAQTANVLWDLYEEYPALQEELSGFKVLMLYGNPVNFISTKDKPIESLGDLKGLNLRLEDADLLVHGVVIRGLGDVDGGGCVVQTLLGGGLSVFGFLDGERLGRRGVDVLLQRTHILPLALDGDLLLLDLPLGGNQLGFCDGAQALYGLLGRSQLPDKIQVFLLVLCDGRVFGDALLRERRDLPQFPAVLLNCPINLRRIG